MAMSPSLLRRLSGSPAVLPPSAPAPATAADVVAVFLLWGTTEERSSSMSSEVMRAARK